MNMNDTSSNSIFTQSLEDSLVRLFSLKPDEITPIELQEIQRLINRIATGKKCEGFYFDEASYKSVLVLPTFEEMGNIGRYLFDFENKSYKYSPTSYVVCISPSIVYSSIKDVVALILSGIDMISCTNTLTKIKAMLLDKSIESNLISGEKVFTFKNDISYNSGCTALLLPFLIQLYEGKQVYFDKNKLLKYLFSDKVNGDSLLVKYGYASYIPHNTSLDGSLEKEEHNKAKMEFNFIFSNMWDNIISYPESKPKMIKWINQVIANPTSGSYEKELASKSLALIKKSNGNILDESLIEKNLNESAKSFIEAKKKGYSYLEIDELKLEIECMNYSEDKMYLITRIHKDLATANKAKRKVKDQSSIEEIDNYINELKNLLTIVQNKKIKTDAEDFTIVVKYPKGDYEE